jgi:hypothetical protein
MTQQGTKLVVTGIDSASVLGARMQMEITRQDDGTAQITLIAYREGYSMGIIVPHEMVQPVSEFLNFTAAQCDGTIKGYVPQVSNPDLCVCGKDYTAHFV